MIKIAYRNCSEIDVSRKIIVVTIAKTNGQDITKYQTKPFFTFIEDLRKCKERLLSNNTVNVCLGHLENIGYLFSIFKKGLQVYHYSF